MSFEPTIPQANADLDAVPIRDNLTSCLGSYAFGMLDTFKQEVILDLLR